MKADDDRPTLCFHGREFSCLECAAEFRRELLGLQRRAPDVNQASWVLGTAPGDGLYWFYGRRPPRPPAVRLTRVRDGRISGALNVGFIGYVDDVVGWWLPCLTPDPPTGLVD